MYFIFRILPIIIMIPLAIYFYFFIKRICLCIFQNINKWHKIICALLAVVFVLPASSFFSFWAVVVLHLFAFAIIMEDVYKRQGIKWCERKYLYINQNNGNDCSGFLGRFRNKFKNVKDRLYWYLSCLLYTSDLSQMNFDDYTYYSRQSDNLTDN